jgi:hypothetical protein
MNQSRSSAGGVKALFDHDEVREVLEHEFFRPSVGDAAAVARERVPRPGAGETAAPRRPRKGTARALPPSRRISKQNLPYEVICISLYREDLAQLDGMVEALKARGLRKMSRSALIRWALRTVDLDGVPRGV